MTKACPLNAPHCNGKLATSHVRRKVQQRSQSCWIPFTIWICRRPQKNSVHFAFLSQGLTPPWTHLPAWGGIPMQSPMNTTMLAQHPRLTPSRLTLRHPRGSFEHYPILAGEQGLRRLGTRKDIRGRFSCTKAGAHRSAQTAAFLPRFAHLLLSTQVLDAAAQNLGCAKVRYNTFWLLASMESWFEFESFCLTFYRNSLQARLELSYSITLCQMSKVDIVQSAQYCPALPASLPSLQLKGNCFSIRLLQCRA